VKLHLNSKNFQTDFITPILEVIKDGRCAVFCENEEIYSVSVVNGLGVYLYNTYKPVKIEEPLPRFNVNLEKLKKGMLCIGNEFVDFDIEKSNLSYKDDTVKLSVRLLEDNSVNVVRFNVETFKNFPFDFEMKIAVDDLVALRRSINFAADTTKFYLQQDEESIYILFGDKQAQHSDSIRVFLTKEFKGTIGENIYDTAILNLILKQKDDIHLKVSANGALLMQIERGSSTLRYITTKLKK